ncbi:MAG: hypothetical protein NTX49_06435 [Chlamydiae bacterium]|nr:hypothetical protein [Chlamydiota bacterium]
MAYALSTQISGFLEQVHFLSGQFEKGMGKGDIEFLFAMQEEAGKYVQIGGALLESERGRMGPSLEKISEAVAIAGSIQDAFTQRITELVSPSVESTPHIARAIHPVASTPGAPHIPAASAARRAIGVAPVYQAPVRGWGAEISRRYPPISYTDTIVYRDGGVVSAHGKTSIFKDDEIRAIHGVVRHQSVGGSDVVADFTKRGKAIIQQQATRGCTAAVTAMLILDNDRAPNIRELSNRNLGNQEVMFRDLKDAGLTPATTSYSNLVELKSRLESCGSLICSMGFPSGGHVIVVDEVSDDLSTVRVRDPYHGWEITVDADAFKKYARLDRKDYVAEGIYVKEGSSR